MRGLYQLEATSPCAGSPSPGALLVLAGGIRNSDVRGQDLPVPSDSQVSCTVCVPALSPLKCESSRGWDANPG